MSVAGQLNGQQVFTCGNSRPRARKYARSQGRETALRQRQSARYQPPGCRRRVFLSGYRGAADQEQLFQYIDEAGERHCIDSADVNDYLREISGRDITAKDFRTWAATNLAVLALASQEREPPTRKAQVAAIKEVARRLGNTPAVCRKCYIHPAVLDGYLNGTLRRTLAAVGNEEQPREMWRIERIVMRYLAEQPGATS